MYVNASLETQALSTSRSFGSDPVGDRKPCPEHDYDLLRPVVMVTSLLGVQGDCPDEDAVLVETQAVQESVKIPGTDLFLVYHSSRARGYQSTIRIQLTPGTISPSLRRVHLRIMLEGLLFTKIFEADPGIKYTYSWNRQNVYKQGVYGKTTARVSVGYEHTGCGLVIWEHQTVNVAAKYLTISAVGDFNIHIHHSYNFNQGILQRGDGSNKELAEGSRLVTTLLGTGEQREVSCDARCSGIARTSPLLSPSCLAAAPNGSLYVGDFNLIRKVSPDGTVTTVARLNETGVSYRYHIAVSPLDGSVYVSDPEAHQVLRLRQTDSVSDPAYNTAIFAGSGQRCLPGDRAKCGDGGNALHARLSYPKGLAMSASGDLYIADGTNIRVVTAAGTIHTVLGGHEHRSHWSPVPCNGTIEREQLRLRWPTELAISPLDGTLHVLDDHLVLRLTPDNRVQVVTGRPLHCPSPPTDPPHMSRAALLLAPQSIAFSLKGDLYVAESDTQRINRIRVITTDGHISTFAGAETRCNCRDPTCFCHAHENVLATSAVFPSISAIAVTPDDVVHISDQAGYRVRSIKSLLPKANEKNEYEIFSPDTHEVYVFNRFGQHVSTRNIVTGQIMYKFAYTVKSPSGKLSTVTDAAENRIQLMRDGNGEVTSIENPLKQRIQVRLNMRNQLEELVAPNGYNITFRYHVISGLLQSKVERGGSTYSYEYDSEGRLSRTVLPTGQVISLDYTLSERGAEVTVSRDGRQVVSTMLRGTGITHTAGFEKTVSQGKGGLVRSTKWNHEVMLQETPYKVLEAMSATASQMFPVLAVQQTRIAGDTINRYEWVYSPSLPATAELHVNNVSLLMLRYDPFTKTEALLSPTGLNTLVNVSYDGAGHATHYEPMHPMQPASVIYNHWGHVVKRQHGNIVELYEYDHLLRQNAIIYGDNTTLKFIFKDRISKPLHVVLPSGQKYDLLYDDAGALRQILTPLGTSYSLHLTMSIGCYKLKVVLPKNKVALQLRVDEQGRLLSVTQPGGGTRLFEYDTLGRLRGEYYGLGFTEFDYWEWGLLRVAKSRYEHNEVRYEYQYHGGLTKEMKLRFRSSGSDLHKIRVHYLYDTSGRLMRIELKIDATKFDPFYVRFNNQTGILQAVSDLRIVRPNILETNLVDQNRHFMCTRLKDDYGRMAQKTVTLQGRNVFHLKLNYDSRGRIAKMVIEISGRQELTNHTYTVDGQLEEATGTHKWLYSYNQNGNLLSSTDNTRAEFLHYDECDRVKKVGDGNIEYDARGFVIRYDQQNFEYDTKGLLIKGWAPDRRWEFQLFYDHLDRVYLYRDHQKNVTQFIYGRLDEPKLITHIHNPRTQATTTLIYDDLNHLIALDSPNGRYYVASDHAGTPLAFFEENGSLIHRQRWSSFGRLVESAGERIWVGVGPWGSFVEPITGVILVDGRPYHPRLLQWLAPQWQQLTKAPRHVSDVYVYRFRGNDPINPPQQLHNNFHDMTWWLRMTGIELKNTLGSQYKDRVLEFPAPSLDVSLKPSIGISSSLTCQYRAGINYLQHISFFHHSKADDEELEWQRTPISQQSYVFGPGVLVSRVNGRVLINFVPVVEDGSSVVGDVIRIVLNNSLLLDVVATENDHETFYFIWEEKRREVEHEKHLARLSGIFNVTKVNDAIGAGVHVATPTANFMILYGVRPERARSYVLEQLEKRAANTAWAREADLITAGRPGTREWQQEEQTQLIKNGYVRGFLASPLHSTDDFPFLAADPSNVMFRRDTSRKRRKSRRKNRNKGWRRRDWSRDTRAT